MFCSHVFFVALRRSRRAPTVVWTNHSHKRGAWLFLFVALRGYRGWPLPWYGHGRKRRRLFLFVALRGSQLGPCRGIMEHTMITIVALMSHPNVFLFVALRESRMALCGRETRRGPLFPNCFFCRRDPELSVRDHVFCLLHFQRAGSRAGPTRFQKDFIPYATVLSQGEHSPARRETAHIHVLY